jgi:hypothetical protein
MRTKEELIEAVGRVAFSYESMSYSGEWLEAHEGQEVETGLWDAHVDSFLVHARRLLEFINPKGPKHDDDVHISDMLEPVPDLTSTHSEDVININKRIAHLTYSTEPERVNWPVPDLMEELTSAMKTIIQQMAKDTPELVTRLQAGVDKRAPTFRKLIR